MSFTFYAGEVDKTNPKKIDCVFTDIQMLRNFWTEDGTEVSNPEYIPYCELTLNNSNYYHLMDLLGVKTEEFLIFKIDIDEFSEVINKIDTSKFDSHIKNQIFNLYELVKIGKEHGATLIYAA